MHKKERFSAQIMKYALIISLLILFSCKRKNSVVLVQVIDKDTGFSIGDAKVQVIRKGKKGFLNDKESLLIGENYTNANGEVLINFKYDRGNVYALFVYEAKEYFQNTRYQYFDLEKGRNQEYVYMNQLSYIKLNLKSNSPNSKKINIKINDFDSFYNQYFYSQSIPIDTLVFCKARSTRGNKNITYSVDSAGFVKNYSFPIELKGHDTTYATVTF